MSTSRLSSALGEPVVAALVLLHAVRRARSDQRCHARGARGGLRRTRRLLGAGKAAFEQAAHRLDERLLPADLLAACAIQPHLLGEIDDPLQRARAPVDEHQQAGQRQQEEIEGDIEAVAAARRRRRCQR